MKLTVIGCGDAFGSGGRYQSCYLLDTSSGRIMIDCGANTPLALKRAGISIDTVDAIFISHCHGDHFGGLPFLLLDKLFVTRTGKAVEIFGSQGIEARTVALMECLYPGIMAMPCGFDLTYRGLTPGSVTRWRELTITPYLVHHECGSPPLAFSISDGERRFAFSGDTGWCDGVIEAGRDAHLYLIESTTLEPQSTMHLDYRTLSAMFKDIGAERYVLTHMGEEMLAASAEVDRSRCDLAHDGLVIAV